MIMDFADWHPTKKIKITEYIYYYLPLYFPELNPIEYLWNLIREQKEFMIVLFVL